ncbi:glyoxalase [Roseivirga sp. 4D4]|uniref:VOC family protein n=1 Tax=Roseivirga sp. 4D4 TaxID=1889784 RepID=UPI0008537C0C|nr:VOC family protein [Roseivirga sp. 4D4]OEK01104.1 glyoxalase [Roseivirga sp. 4D4]
MDKKDNTSEVTGIGGVFFTSSNPNKLKEWYTKNLGLDLDEHGIQFRFREHDDPDKEGIIQWSIFSENSDYFAPSNSGFMINYRVQNIETLVESLREKGVQIVDSIQSYPYGKFVHVLDSDNNKIELWEPPTSF